MLSFDDLSDKKKIIIAGSIIFIITLVVVLFFVSRRTQPSTVPSSEPTFPASQITPNNLPQSGDRGTTSGGGIPRRPTQTPEEKQDEFNARIPIKGNGFLLRLNQSTNQYEAYIYEPYSSSREEVTQWLRKEYPSIPISSVQFINVSPEYSNTNPYQIEDSLVVPGTQNTTIYTTAPTENIQQLIPTTTPGLPAPTITQIIVQNIVQPTPSPTQSNTISPEVRNPTSVTSSTSRDNLPDRIPTTDYNRVDEAETLLENYIALKLDIDGVPSNSTSSNTDQDTELIIDDTDPMNFPSNNEVQYSTTIVNSVMKCANAQNQAVYKRAESMTGVPWKVLAAIHYMEGNCNLNQSLVSGRQIGAVEPDVGRKCSSADSGIGKPYPLKGGCAFRNLLDSAIYGAVHLRDEKFGGRVPKTIEELAYALGRYNGTGNRNCGKTPYPHCPPSFDNDDHIYAMSKFDRKHETMYLIYCADYTKCNPPQVFQRIGALTVINILTEKGF